MNRINTILLLLFCSVYCLAQQATIPVPKPFQLKWHQAEMGAVFHYDLLCSTEYATDKATTASIR